MYDAGQHPPAPGDALAAACEYYDTRSSSPYPGYSYIYYCSKQENLPRCISRVGMMCNRYVYFCKVPP